MKYGHACVSSAGQKLSAQVKQLQEVDFVLCLKRRLVEERSSTCLLREYKKVILLLLRR